MSAISIQIDHIQTHDGQPSFVAASRHGTEEDSQREGYIDASVEELHNVRSAGGSCRPKPCGQMCFAGSPPQVQLEKFIERFTRVIMRCSILSYISFRTIRVTKNASH